MLQDISNLPFFERFPNEDACLARIMDVRFGLKHSCARCGKESTFHKLSDRRSFSCANCGDQIYPCAGTIFQDSRVSLHAWFYAIYLLDSSRSHITAKDLQRLFAVTYKTAWRMAKRVRQVMSTPDGKLMLRSLIDLAQKTKSGVVLS